MRPHEFAREAVGTCSGIVINSEGPGLMPTRCGLPVPRCQALQQHWPNGRLYCADCDPERTGSATNNLLGYIRDGNETAAYYWAIVRYRVARIHRLIKP
jgi:hypothetical protein